MALVEHMSVKAAACGDWPTEWRHSAASSPYTALPARAPGCTPKSHSAAPTHTNSRGRANESTALSHSDGAVAEVGADGLAEIAEPHKVVLSASETSSGQIGLTETGLRIDAWTCAT